MDTRLHSMFGHKSVLAALAIGGLAACDSQNVTAPQLSRGPLTIDHGYIIYQTVGEYKAAFATADAKLRAERLLSPRMTCEMQTTRHAPNPALSSVSGNPTSSRDWISTDGDPFFRIGALRPYKVQSTTENGGGIPWGILQLFYPIPGRYLMGNCGDFGGVLYGDIGQPIEYAAVDEGYGYAPMANPPSEPPPGVESEDYWRLTPGERELMWWKYEHSTLAQFAQFVNDMYSIRSQAETWAALEEPEGQEDGPQDALRHAMWMCRMYQQFGQTFARDWGVAHEEGHTDPRRAIMDTHNNAVGRRIAAESGLDCYDGVRFARDAGWLILSIGTQPTSTWPRQPTPPGSQPPLDQ